MPGHDASDEEDDSGSRIIEDQGPANQRQGHDPNPPMALPPGKSIKSKSVDQDSTNPQHVTGVVSVRKKSELRCVRPKGDSCMYGICNRDSYGQTNNQYGDERPCS